MNEMICFSMKSGNFKRLKYEQNLYCCALLKTSTAVGKRWKLSAVSNIMDWYDDWNREWFPTWFRCVSIETHSIPRTRMLLTNVNVDSMTREWKRNSTFFFRFDNLIFQQLSNTKFVCIKHQFKALKKKNAQRKKIQQN